MEFWGVEVKGGQPLNVVLGEGKVLHLSMACLGEFKKKYYNPVCLHIKINGKKLALGTLHAENMPQLMFDLVFDQDFQLSHNSNDGGVFFHGYITDQPSCNEEEHAIPSVVKKDSKQNVKIVKPKEDVFKSVLLFLLGLIALLPFLGIGSIVVIFALFCIAL